MNQLAFTRHVPQIGAVQRLAAPLGSSIADLAPMAGDDGTLLAYVEVRPGYWEPAPRERWRFIKPKRKGVVRFYARLQGGGGSGRILALVAMVALTAIAGPLGGLLATSLGFAAGGIAAGLFSAGIIAGGSLLLGKLFPGEQQGRIGSDAERAATAIEDITAAGNLLARDAYLPRIFGEANISLPDIVQPHVYLDDGVQTVERLLAADGGHLIEDVRIDGALVDDIAAVTVETRDGQPGTSVYTMIERYTLPLGIADELGTFRLADTGGRDLEDQTDPENSAPIPLTFKARKLAGMKEIAMRLRIDALVKPTSPTTSIRLPLRIRMRQEGGTWINWPEIHIAGVDQGTRLMDIRVRADTDFGGGDVSGALAFTFWRRVPPAALTLADGNTGDQWTADSHFSIGSGLQDVSYIYGRRQGVRAVLTEALFPEGDYEFEITRGIITDTSSLNSSYQISGNVVSLFVAASESGTWRVPVAQSNYQTRASISHATVIAEGQPCQRPGTALVALRSRQSVRNVTAKLTGYARDWDGSGWNNWVATRNPALQTRQLLADLVEYSRVAEHSRLPRIAALAQSVLEDTDWTGWKAQCNTMGATCSLVSAGEPVGDVLARLMAAGLARPAFGAKLRIDYFRDRSAEQPIITFSPRNGQNVRIKYESPRRPMGMRATFRNRNDDWADDELEVLNPISGNTPNWLKADLRAFDDPEWVRARLTFDMLRAHYWRTRYEVTTPLEGLGVMPGSLVGIVTDLVNDRCHGARVRQVVDSQTLVIDQVIEPEQPDPDLDDWEFADLFEVGEQSFAQIITPDGSELKAIVDAATSANGMTIVLDSPLADTPGLGSHLTIGSLSNRIRRCIVVEATPGDEYSASLLLADEAPEIYATLAEQFGW